MQANIQYALNHAVAHNSHVIVVVPEARYKEATLFLVAEATDKRPFGGRTLYLGEGGLISMRACSDVPPSEDFMVMFVGWGSATGAEEMTRWKNAARQVITRLT